jgi:hypothetical protein
MSDTGPGKTVAFNGAGLIENPKKYRIYLIDRTGFEILLCKAYKLLQN